MGQGGEAKAAGEEVEQVGRGQTKKGLLFFGFLSKGMESHGGLSDLRVWVFFSSSSFCQCSREHIGDGNFGSRKSSLKAIALT